MVTSVIKRDGSIEEFNFDCIVDAAKRAYNSYGKEVPAKLFNHIKKHIEEIEDGKTPTVEDILDIMEESLGEIGEIKILRSFIQYRFRRKLKRETKRGSYKGTTLVDCAKTIWEYVNGTDWRVKANANAGYSHAGLIKNTAGKIIANFWLDQVFSPEEGKAHRDGDIYIHDLDNLSIYCVGHSLRQLLNLGFGTGKLGRPQSRPPRHLNNAIDQMVNYLSCFTDDTEINMSDGSRRTIRELIDSGETEWQVKSYNPNTDEVIDARFHDLRKMREVEEYLELEFWDGDKVKCTPDHKFYTLNRGWVEAQDLNEEDELPKLDRKTFLVYKVTNNITGDFYIGSHVTWDVNDGYLGSGVGLTLQLKEYGAKNFTKEILCFCDDEESLRRAEQNYILAYADDIKLLNRTTALNWGYLFTVAQAGKLKHREYSPTLYGVLIYKGHRAFYCKQKERLEKMLGMGWKIVDPAVVRNDGYHDYIPEDYKDSGLKESELFIGPWDIGNGFGSLGYVQTEEHRKRKSEAQLLSYRTSNHAERIREALNTVGPDGLTPVARAMNRVCENGLTVAQNNARAQMESGRHIFLSNNPNFWIDPETGETLPAKHNRLRVEAGTHNFVYTTRMGCHNKVLQVRVRQIADFYGDATTWRVNKTKYEEFLAKFPDWTGKFCYEGFVYSVHKTKQWGNLSVNVSVEE